MLSFLNSHILGIFLPIILAVAGLFLLIRLKFFPILHPIKVIKPLFRKKNDGISPFKAACVALSGTLGVGNIAGVAAAISIGGAGSVFWMWVSAFFAMIIKYAEVTTTMSFRVNGHGGAPYYIEKGLKSRFFGAIFAVLIIGTSFSVGNIVQSSAAAEALSGGFGVSKLAVGIMFAAVTFVLIKGGVRRIADFSAVIIPILSLGYILLSMAIIIKNIDAMPSVMRMIFDDAFTFSSAAGGAVGFIANRAIRYGASRGLLSNEAGCGTAAYAHAATENEPAEQGFFGILEVFVDTVLLCSLTAFVVLLAFPSGCYGENGMAIAVDAFDSFFGIGGEFIAVSSAIYAIASVVCWSFYGDESLIYIGAGRRARLCYMVLYSGMGILGAVFAPSFVWELADFSISLMGIINTVCLCLLSGVAVRVTNRYFR